MLTNVSKNKEEIPLHDSVIISFLSEWVRKNLFQNSIPGKSLTEWPQIFCHFSFFFCVFRRKWFFAVAEMGICYFVGIFWGKQKRKKLWKPWNFTPEIFFLFKDEKHCLKKMKMQKKFLNIFWQFVLFTCPNFISRMC